MRMLLALVLALAAALAGAAPLALPQPPRAGIEQHLGSALPIDEPLLDAAGRSVTLRELLRAGRPLVLVPGYYSCPELCGLVIRGVLQAMHDGRVEAGVVRVSIDPQDTPATAAAQRARDLDYAQWLGGPAPELHLLTGAGARGSTLLRALGYRFEATSDDAEPAARFAHPAAVVVVTPQGRIARYFMGVQLDGAELRAAVDSAAGEGIGTWTDRLALLCAHFDPRVGRHTELVMNILRASGVLTMAALGAWWWRRRTPPGAAS